MDKGTEAQRGDDLSEVSHIPSKAVALNPKFWTPGNRTFVILLYTETHTFSHAAGRWINCYSFLEGRAAPAFRVPLFGLEQDTPASRETQARATVHGWASRAEAGVSALACSP